jgi:hypothetical protein
MMSTSPQTQTAWQAASQGFWVLVGLSFIGFPAIIVFAFGVSVLLFVLRLVLLAVSVPLAALAFVAVRMRHLAARPGPLPPGSV